METGPEIFAYDFAGLKSRTSHTPTIPFEVANHPLESEWGSQLLLRDDPTSNFFSISYFFTIYYFNDV